MALNLEIHLSESITRFELYESSRSTFSPFDGLNAKFTRIELIVEAVYVNTRRYFHCRCSLVTQVNLLVR